jgi:hypothetical protein
MSTKSQYCLIWISVVAVAPTAWATNGVILDQQLDDRGRGHTVLRVWGTHYEMGFAQGTLLAEAIQREVEEYKLLLGLPQYQELVRLMDQYVWTSPVDEELQGMADGVAVRFPEATIDKGDLQLLNTHGDWRYACRSHTCWGRYVEPPTRTLSTRRLDYDTAISSMNHHVLCAWDPGDGSPRWVNLAFPGYVLAATGVNEHGTLVSLHDFQPAPGDCAPGCMPRLVACRHALAWNVGADPSTHANVVFGELQKYEIMVGSFLNYYAPEGLGGVIAVDPQRVGPDAYDLRTPQPAWHHGEAMVTTNRWTDGTFTPADEDFSVDAFYDADAPKTQEEHWSLLSSHCPPEPWCSLHLLSVAYRAREDMTIWADGRLDGAGRTPRLEWEWRELFPNRAKVITVDLRGSGDYEDIQSATDAAADGDTVLVLAGEYVIDEPIDFNRLHDPEDPGSPTVKNITVRSEAGPGETTVRMSETPADPDRASVVIFENGEDGRSELRGLSLTGGGWLGPEDRHRGGGVLCLGASPAVRDCLVSGNSATWGGGIYLDGGARPQIEDCTFQWNDGNLGGGGIACRGVGTAPRFSGCLILDNFAFAPGGGVYCDTGSLPVFTNCRISGNHASFFPWGGPARGGGLYLRPGASATLANCIISGNFTDSILKPAGHGLYSDDESTLVLHSCTITGNLFEPPFQGVCAVYFGERSSIEMANCIVWGNDFPSVEAAGDADLRISYSCIEAEAPWPGEGNLNADPLFVQPGHRDPFNQGATWHEGDCHLQPGSPCIDTGTCDGAPTFDIEGRARPLGAGCDMGAHEFSAPPEPEFRRGDANGDGAADISDAIATLGFLFLGESGLDCRDAADANDDGLLDISDAIATLGVLFLGEGEIPPPGMASCGVDPTGDELDCETYAPCP